MWFLASIGSLVVRTMVEPFLAPFDQFFTADSYLKLPFLFIMIITGRSAQVLKVPVFGTFD